MISRYFLNIDKNELKYANNEAYQLNYNVQPSHLMPVIDMHSPEGLSYFYWGTTPENSKGKAVSSRLINANKSELLQKNTYKRALQYRRCLVPMNGFYAWKMVAKKRLVPYCITPQKEQLLLAAGIWEEYENFNNQTIHTFTLIVHAELGSTKEVSPLSPVYIAPEFIDAWFDTNNELDHLMAILEQVQPNLKKHSISNKINDFKANDVSLLKPAPAADQYGNYSLFD